MSKIQGLPRVKRIPGYGRNKGALYKVKLHSRNRCLGEAKIEAALDGVKSHSPKRCLSVAKIKGH